jgi:hypothetical protein
MAGHAPFSVAQIPQPALQHFCPLLHVFLPHEGPLLSRSHLSSPALSVHCSPALQAGVHVAGASGTQRGMGGQGARTHCTWTSSQELPPVHLTVSHDGSALHSAWPVMSSQYESAGHFLSSHLSAGGGPASGRQAMAGHGEPFCSHRPQLALQHISLGPHVFSPHGVRVSRPASGTSTTGLVHTGPKGVIAHSVPFAQARLQTTGGGPASTTGSATHAAPLAPTLQCVPEAHAGLHEVGGVGGLPDASTVDDASTAASTGRGGSSSSSTQRGPSLSSSQWLLSVQAKLHSVDGDVMLASSSPSRGP